MTPHEHGLVVDVGFKFGVEVHVALREHGRG